MRRVVLLTDEEIDTILDWACAGHSELDDEEENLAQYFRDVRLAP